MIILAFRIAYSKNAAELCQRRMASCPMHVMPTAGARYAANKKKKSRRESNALIERGDNVANPS